MLDQNAVPTNKTFNLKDGRILSYHEFGDPNGVNVLYFHGFPGSGAEGRFFHQGAQIGGMRIISPDRPGMGDSSFYTPRKLMDWPQDVIQLADYLGIDEFVILGVSGGAPYALVCGRYLPASRLKGIITISGLAPLDKDLKGIEPLFQMGIRLGRISPRIMSFGLQMLLTRRYHTEEKALKATIRDVKSFPEEDRILFEHPENIKIYSRLMFEAFKNGTEPVKEEALIYLRSWGFDLSDINSEIPVEIWHGTNDKILPSRMAEKLASQIVHAQLRLFSNEGHLSTVMHNGELLNQRIRFYMKNS